MTNTQTPITRTPVSEPSRWVRLPELADMLDASPAAAARYAKYETGFPEPSQWVKGGIRRWERTEVEAWMKKPSNRPQRVDAGVPAVADRRRGPKLAAV
jgi:predicted DNA-binding transcriptional regulator AlpA